MATSKDFEKIWNQYQVEIQSTGKSIVTFCQENGIVYSQFERWYKTKGKTSAKTPQLVPVEIIGCEGIDLNSFVHSQWHKHTKAA